MEQETKAANAIKQFRPSDRERPPSGKKEADEKDADRKDADKKQEESGRATAKSALSDGSGVVQDVVRSVRRVDPMAAATGLATGAAAGGLWLLQRARDAVPLY